MDIKTRKKFNSQFTWFDNAVKDFQDQNFHYLADDAPEIYKGSEDKWITEVETYDHEIFEGFYNLLYIALTRAGEFTKESITLLTDNSLPKYDQIGTLALLYLINKDNEGNFKGLMGKDGIFKTEAIKEAMNDAFYQSFERLFRSYLEYLLKDMSQTVKNRLSTQELYVACFHSWRDIF